MFNTGSGKSLTFEIALSVAMRLQSHIMVSPLVALMQIPMKKKLGKRSVPVNIQDIHGYELLEKTEDS